MQTKSTISCNAFRSRHSVEADRSNFQLFLDIDECANEALFGVSCDASLSEVCHNTVGSYTCVCRDGYQRGEDQNCASENIIMLSWESVIACCSCRYQ